ncbi:MAG: hypothetical protein HY747_06815 [Elusimicrobia bacterium]|nr:hypothetical protein [Elusimicrobiota bacterium]
MKVDDYGRRLMSLACFNPQEAQTAMMNVGAFAGIAGSIFNLSYFDMCGEFCSHPRPRDRTRFLGLPPP